MIQCPYCHFENEDGALFCEQCKSDLGVPETAAVHQAVPAAVEGPESIPVAAVPEASAPMAAMVVEGASGSDAVPVAEVAVSESALAETPSPVAETLAEPIVTPPPAAEPSAPPLTEATAPPTAQPAPEPAAPLPPDTRPKLVVVRGQRINAEYPLYEGENYIGRADEKAVDVDLEDQEPPDRVWSSRQHALITYEAGNLAIEDLNSTNGTFVNRLRIYPGNKRPLQVGDVIQIGTVHLKVKV
jgi:hypothetical protein